LLSVVKSRKVDDAVDRLYTHVPLSDNVPKRHSTVTSIVDEPIGVAGRLPTPNRNEAAVLWTAFIVLMNLKLKHPAELPSQLLQRIRTIMDVRRSATYQPVLAEGKAEGYAEGEA
jgi:hypothetical protein